MPKHTPKPGSNWGVEVNARSPNGQQIYGPDGKPCKIKVKMRDGTFADGLPQPLYFPEGHPHAGVFKGMAVILEERRFENAGSLWLSARSSNIRLMETGVLLSKDSL